MKRLGHQWSSSIDEGSSRAVDTTHRNAHKQSERLERKEDVNRQTHRLTSESDRPCTLHCRAMPLTSVISWLLVSPQQATWDACVRALIREHIQCMLYACLCALLKRTAKTSVLSHCIRPTDPTHHSIVKEKHVPAWLIACPFNVLHLCGG